MFGAIGLSCVVTWPLLHSYRRALVVQGIGAIAFAAHFALLGALTASASCALSLIQLTIAGAVCEPHLRRKLNILVLVTLMLLAIATWDGIASALVASGGLISTIARCQNSTARMKAIFIAAAPFWLTHDLIVKAPFALAVDLIAVTGNLVGLYLAGRRLKAERSVPLATALVA